MSEQIFIGVVIGVLIAVITGSLAWFSRNLWQKLWQKIQGLREPKVTSGKKWRKDAAARRARGDYKTFEEMVADAIREYRETGKSTTIPTETLEDILRMISEPPVPPPARHHPDDH